MSGNKVSEETLKVFGDSIHQDHPQTIEEEEGEMLHSSRKGLEEQDIPAKGLRVEDKSLLSPAKGMASAGEARGQSTALRVVPPVRVSEWETKAASWR